MCNDTNSFVVTNYGELNWTLLIPFLKTKDTVLWMLFRDCVLYFEPNNKCWGACKYNLYYIGAIWLQQHQQATTTTKSRTPLFMFDHEKSWTSRIQVYGCIALQLRYCRRIHEQIHMKGQFRCAVLIVCLIFFIADSWHKSWPTVWSPISFYWFIRCYLFIVYYVQWLF